MAPATHFDNLHVPQTRLFLATSLPTAPETYYGGSAYDVTTAAWKGGEIMLNTSDYKIYVQTETSGRTATWKRLVDATETVT